jgi:hypothetical protein
MEKAALVVAGVAVTAATAKAILDGGLVVVTGKTVIACGKAATILACKLKVA